MTKPPDTLVSLLAVTGSFWRGTNLRRFLLVLIPFALTSVLTYKILSGQWFNFHPTSYASWSLGGSFLFPLNIFQVPAQVLILGLFLCLLMTLPVLAAQLFGLAPAVFFVACVFWLAHLPIMALFLLVAVFLAANPILLRRSRFYSALLGLVPTMAYLLLSVSVVFTKTDPAYANNLTPSNSLLVSILAHLVSRPGVCIVVPIFMLLVFFIGLPSILWKGHFYLSGLVFIPVGAYLTGAIFIGIQPGDHIASWVPRSAAELIWPEMSLAGQTSRQALINLSPTQQTWLYAPVLLTVILALVLLPVLLLFVRWMKRPALVLALATCILALTGLIVFYRVVGPETLDYAILRSRFEPNSALFRNFSALEKYRQRLEQYRLASDPSMRLKVERELADLQDLLSRATGAERIAELEGQIRQFTRRLRHARQPDRSAALGRSLEIILRGIVGEFEDRIATAKRACEKFLKTYPRSRHKPHVLYIKASALDARIDQERLRYQGTMYVYYHFPSPESKTAWQELVDGSPQDVLACPSGLALARLLAREGSFDLALQILEQAHEAGQSFLDSPSTARPEGFFYSQLGLPITEPISMELVSSLLRQIRRLSDLIADNYRDPVYGPEPLRRFFAKDPESPDYIEQIENIRAEFPNALVADNIWLQMILARSASQQLSLLQSAVNEFDGLDAGREALFHLAQLEMTLAKENPDNILLHNKAREHLRQFLQDYPQSYRAPLVREQLARLSLLSSPGE